jgi:hypothetical protein
MQLKRKALSKWIERAKSAKLGPETRTETSKDGDGRRERRYIKTKRSQHGKQQWRERQVLSRGCRPKTKTARERRRENKDEVWERVARRTRWTKEERMRRRRDGKR